MGLGKIGGVFDRIKKVVASDNTIFKLGLGNHSSSCLRHKSYTYSDIGKIIIPANGSIRAKANVACGNNSYPIYVIFVVTREGLEVSRSVEFTTRTSYSGKYFISYDFSDVKYGDELIMFVRDSESTGSLSNAHTVIYNFEIGGTLS